MPTIDSDENSNSLSFVDLKFLDGNRESRVASKNVRNVLKAFTGVFFIFFLCLGNEQLKLSLHDHFNP